MKIAFEDKGRNLSEKAIASFEKRQGISLPHDYRDFLLEANGGIPEEDYSFSFFEDGKETESVLGQFYTLARESDIGTLEEGLETYVKENRMPGWFLPVADDAFGNQICISLTKDDFGFVYFWNHEREPSPGANQPPFNNVFLVAKSFQEFIDKLEMMSEE